MRKMDDLKELVKTLQNDSTFNLLNKNISAGTLNNAVYFVVGALTYCPDDHRDYDTLHAILDILR